MSNDRKRYPEQHFRSQRIPMAIRCASSESEERLVGAYNIGFRCPDCGSHGEAVIFRTDTTVAKVISMLLEIAMSPNTNWFVIGSSHGHEPELRGPFPTPLQALDSLTVIDDETAQALRSAITLDQLESNPKVSA